MSPVYEIWGDNELESSWFQELDKRFKNANIKTIGRRGTNTKLIDGLVFYDRPDIILLKDGKPVLVLEKTQEVPTGHNVGQRVARLVRAAESQIPVLYFLPFDARKHGKHTGICSINTRLIKAMLKMSEIHECPIVPIKWPTDSHGELVRDGSEDNEVKHLVGSILDSYPEKWNPVARNYTSLIEEEMERRNDNHPPYRKLPTSAKIVNTVDFFHGSRDKQSQYETLLGRKTSLVYTMDMSPESCRREDPYTGMQFIYDYGWLRKGPKPSDRDSNLILEIPQVTVSRWKTANPNDPMLKASNWYLTADAIALKDGIILIEHE